MQPTVMMDFGDMFSRLIREAKAELSLRNETAQVETPPVIDAQERAVALRMSIAAEASAEEARRRQAAEEATRRWQVTQNGNYGRAFGRYDFLDDPDFDFPDSY